MIVKDFFMFRLSVDFRQALQRTAVLFATALTMIFIWNYLRIPEGNLLIIVFAFLLAVRIYDFYSWQIRLKVFGGMICSAIIMQYSVSATHNIQMLNILVPTAVSCIILRTQPSASAYPALLTGFLAYTAPAGAYAAALRSIDILIAGATAWLIIFVLPGKIDPDRTDDPGQPLTAREAFIESFTIFCAIFLYKMLSIPQGIWIVLTIIFIYLARQPGKSITNLIRQRIFSVPLGILLGGIYSGTAVIFDYRLAYLAPLIGSTGFFMLYYRHDFFSFSMLFMIAFTVCADWMTGTFREFNFLQFLFARSLATVIGTAVLLFVEKTSAIDSTPMSTV